MKIIKECVPKYCFCCLFFFCLNSKQLWKNVYLINTEAIKLFDSFITSITRIANLAILTHLEDEQKKKKKSNKEYLLISFLLRSKFNNLFSPQTPFYWLWCFIVKIARLVNLRLVNNKKMDNERWELIFL